MLALLASALGVVPLMSLLSDLHWLIDAWLAMALVIVPAALLRLRRPPGALDIWPGIILLVPWLTWMYLSDAAWHGVIPTGATFTRISQLMSDLHDTTSHGVAPVHSTVAARLVLSALLGLLAALIDLIAVVGRRGALAGVPLLIVYTVSGAVPREPVNWVWFVVAAIGFLMLLALDAADELLDWGRRVSRAGATRSRPGLAFSANRIGVLAVAVAVALPLLLPADTRNALAGIFHPKSGGGGLGSIGANGEGTSIDPYVELRGQLVRDKPVEVMRVHVDAPAGVQPFYVRLNVLDNFTGDGWRPGPTHGVTEPVSATSYSSLPPSGQPDTQSFQAFITITGLAGNAPVFDVPVSLQGLDGGATWSPQDQLLLGSDVHQGEQISEVVAQPDPTPDQLRADPGAPLGDMSRLLALPQLPTYVTRLVDRLTAGKQTPFDRAQAIFQYFADPANHFQYTLQTTDGDSGSDLVDFLQNKRGFCQQYAGAMGVMLRAAHIPTRLVLGYMHSPPDNTGDFTVSTFDAHSWVEAYFAGAGWVPFDPTPAVGLAGGKKSDLPWARHVYPSSSGVDVPSVSSSASPGASQSRSGSQSVSGSRAGSSSGGLDLALVVTALAVLALIAVALVPAAVRWSRRRARLGAARRGDTDALWAELSDTAIDLGYVWSESRSPRQVATWLAGDAGDSAAQLSALATAVEHCRYARDGAPDAGPGDGPALSEGLIAVTERLWSRRSGRVRLQARLWPASLGWGARMTRMRGALRRH
jgi:transglutaminase-like putative cysteine protease